MRRSIVIGAALALSAGAVQAEEISCKGNITSIQGEGLVHMTHRFEVEVKGNDVAAILDQCRQIALDRQNRAARQNPGGAFRKNSDVNLQCVQGGATFAVKRLIQTQP